MDKEPQWIKIAEDDFELDFGQNNIATIKVEGKKICITRTMGTLKACAAMCPHAGGNLSKGFIGANGNIICPVHHYRFSLNTGMDSLGEGYRLKIYSLKQNEDGIFINIE